MCMYVNTGCASVGVHGRFTGVEPIPSARRRGFRAWQLGWHVGLDQLARVAIFGEEGQAHTCCFERS
jgi:hypothetical protein